MVFHPKYATRERAYYQVQEDFDKDKSTINLKGPDELLAKCIVLINKGMTDEV